MELFVTMRHHTNDTWHSSVITISACLGWSAKTRGSISSPSALGMDHSALRTCSQCPTEEGEAAEEPLHLTNTAALTPCQDGGTQPSHTKERGKPVPKQPLRLEERQVSDS